MTDSKYTIKYSDAKANFVPDMAVGTVIPERMRDSVAYLANIKDYNKTDMDDIYKIIKLCRKLYFFGDVFSTAVDTLVDFPITDFSIQNVKDEKAQRICNYVKDRVNADNENAETGLYQLVKSMAHEFWVDGNSFPYEKWERISDKSHKFKSVYVPTQITLLNPLNIKIPKESIVFGGKKMFLKIDKKLVVIIKKGARRNPTERAIFSSLPSIIKNKSKSKKWDGTILLNPEITKHIARKKRHYHAWGIPYLTKTFTAAATKQKLRLLDDSTVEGMINYITIFRIGDPDNSSTWSQPRLSAFAKLLKDPSSSNTIVWSYDVDVITTGPDGKVLDMASKYTQADQDILRALGIPEVLFTGVGSAEGVSHAILAMLEKLNEFRKDLEQYLEYILRKVCVENGFTKEFPKVSWQRMSILDTDAAKDMTLQLYDRGLIPRTILFDEFGYDYEHMRAMRKKENAAGDDDVFAQPDIPFSTKDGGDGQNAPKPKPKKKADPKNQDGRPPGKSSTEIHNIVRSEVDGFLNRIATDLKDKLKSNDVINGFDVSTSVGYRYALVSSIYSRAIGSITTVAKNFKTASDETQHKGRDLRLDFERKTSILRDQLIVDLMGAYNDLSADKITYDDFFAFTLTRVEQERETLYKLIDDLETFESDINQFIQVEMEA